MINHSASMSHGSMTKVMGSGRWWWDEGRNAMKNAWRKTYVTFVEHFMLVFGLIQDLIRRYMIYLIFADLA